jgi:putative DNA primase/helicase
LPNGISAEGALVLQGKQLIGKTYWMIKLVPFAFKGLIKEAMKLNTNNKDDVMKVTRTWIAELGEIATTFKASEVEDLKNFITTSTDEYRAPYGEIPKPYPRRTIFYGSVNEQSFLKDMTGNRRYWVIAANKINYNHNIDMQQLWAEIKILFEEGESYRLTEEEHKLLNEENEQFMIQDPLQEAILKTFDWQSAGRYNALTALEVLNHLGVTLLSHQINPYSKRVGAILYKLTGKRSRKSNGKMVFDLPETLINQHSVNNW